MGWDGFSYIPYMLWYLLWRFLKPLDNINEGMFTKGIVLAITAFILEKINYFDCEFTHCLVIVHSKEET